MSSQTPARTARVQRETSESSIDLSIDLDGTGTSDIETGVPFYDHMLTAFAKHSLTDLTVRAKLGWTATTPLESLCKMMVEADLVRADRGVSF